MRRAYALASKCVTEPGRPDESPKVGVVAVSPIGELIAEAHRGEDPDHPGDHAEFLLIQHAGGEGDGKLRGATVYTTLEPCTSRSPGKTPCAARLIKEGVAVVYIGMFDPDARVRERGWHQLNEAGITVYDFARGIREDLTTLNKPFIERYQRGSAISGSATFDYTLNDGDFTIAHGDTEFHTKWSKSGKGSVIAYGQSTPIALARYASIDAIDDPGAYEYSESHQRPTAGQVVIYKADPAYCLIRVDGVQSGLDYGDERTEVSITWQIRVP